MEHYEILIIGAGVAGLSAAKEAYQRGCRSILLLEHKGHQGGILYQCAHRGFGAELNGQEYIQILLQDFPAEVQCRLHTTVLRINHNKTAEVVSAQRGKYTVSFSQLILAAGCREIPPGSLTLAGTRPSGVYTAGQMQEMMNVYGVVPESPVVILGSGDLGLIMAQQIAASGGTVVLVEKNAVCGGMERNRRSINMQSVSVLLNSTVTELFGEKELCAVKLNNGTVLPCKTFLIAVGLCPNQELLYDVGKPEWLHLCGNCNRVHAMIESVVLEGKKAGMFACERLRGAT